MTYARSLIARHLKAAHLTQETGTLRLTSFIQDGPHGVIGRTVDTYLSAGDLAFILAYLVKARPDIFLEIVAMLNAGDPEDYRQWLTESIRRGKPG